MNSRHPCVSAGLIVLMLVLGANSSHGQEVGDYQSVVDRIIAAALAESTAYNRLNEITTRFGSRLSGSQALEDAIDWILAELASDGLANVHGEPVMVPHWERGAESLVMLEPYEQVLPMLGLGGSVKTPRRGITASVMVVDSWDDLEKRSVEARGKIVVFNVPFTTYFETVGYRWGGASAAARAGAVASLVRSVTPLAMALPHTGSMGYKEDAPKIPHAAITIEDAERLQRMYANGIEIRLRLKMASRFHRDSPSRNVIAELPGSEIPEEVVVIGGHIDSWDVGQGAIDDAGGSVAAWEAVRLLQTLGLRPRRTIRIVLWTNEENGLRGGRAYREDHLDELERHVLAIESDFGVFQPVAFRFGGSPAAREILGRIASLMGAIGDLPVEDGGGGADIGPIMREGVPGIGLDAGGEKYFWYHHTAADTFDKVDERELNLCVAALASLAYVVADLPDPLPRD